MPSSTPASATTDPDPASGIEGAKRRSARRQTSVWSRLLRDRAALVGLVFLVVTAIASLIAPLVPVLDPVRTDVGARLTPPSLTHPMGTDQLGRDILSRVVHGARVSIAVALGSVVVASIGGVAVGVLAGLFGGLIDEALMRLMDLAFAFPAILLALTIVAVLGPSTTNLIVALGTVYTPRFARVARASTLSIKTENYVEAARSIGAPLSELMRRHILPNILSPLLIVATVTLASAVLAESGLSFLGLGVQPPYPSWGRMLNEGKGYLEIASWLTIFPGLVVVATVLSFNLVGDSLRDALDPRVRI